MTTIHIFVKIRVSDHSGYCSGSECEIKIYTEKYVLHGVVFDEEDDLYPGKVLSDEELIRFESDIQDLVEGQFLCNMGGGSGYCDGPDDPERKLGKHDYDFKILSGVIVYSSVSDSDDFNDSNDSDDSNDSVD